MKLQLLYAAFFLFLINTLKAQDTKYPDYIILQSGEKINGKVTYAPGDKVSFKSDTKKVSEYLPLQVKGYTRKGVFYIPKYSKTGDIYLFSPVFKEGFDSLAFKKETGYSVKAIGEINLYHRKGWSGSGMNRMPYEYIDLDSKSTPEKIELNLITGILEKKKKPIMPFAELIKSNQELYNKVIAVQKLDIGFATTIIKEYNNWFASQSSTTK